VIQYYWKHKESSETKGASIRIHFSSKPPDLLKRVQETLKTKTKIKICILGICAVGFEHWSNNGGIVSFLQKGGDKKPLKTSKTKVTDDIFNSKTVTKKCAIENFFNDRHASQIKGQGTKYFPQFDINLSPKMPNKYIPFAQECGNK